jgi:hypothetical protein
MQQHQSHTCTYAGMLERVAAACGRCSAAYCACVWLSRLAVTMCARACGRACTQATACHSAACMCLYVAGWAGQFQQPSFIIDHTTCVGQLCWFCIAMVPVSVALVVLACTPGHLWYMPALLCTVCAVLCQLLCLVTPTVHTEHTLRCTTRARVLG